MVSLSVWPSKLSGEISAPPSKSYTHRALIIAALADGESVIRGALLSRDTEATISAIREIGAKVRQDNDKLIISGTGGEVNPRTRFIDAANSGTTIRIMSAVSALSPNPVKLTGDESIVKRPMGPLIEALSKLGARGSCEGKDGRPPVIVGGGLRGGEVEITGEVSSQFVSALLIASPMAKEDVRIRITGKMRSRPYIEMTIKLMEMAGIRVKRDRELKNLKVDAGQVPEPISFTVPGDFSSAAFPLGAAALTDSSIKVNNLNVNMPQGDSRIVSILSDFGADLKAVENSVYVEGCESLSGIEVDCGDNPDLVPILSVIGSFAEGRTRVTNVPHLRYKETDRIRALSLGMTKFGAVVKELDDGLCIEGKETLKGARVESYGDHRMAMAFAVAGLRASGRTVVDGAETIPVSYPGFISDMRKLGAKMETSPG
ncbi:MAG: 3-phosphoshikimate 1-carboxyvinyltransferase [Candidatus Hadarchaeales archaeon]